MKKRFLILLIGLNLLLLSSISMTVAWFIGSTNLAIDGIDLVIDADADLKISLDDNYENAKDSLTKEDLGEIGLFQPVTSMRSEHSEWINNAENTKPIFLGQYLSTYKKLPTIYEAYSGYFSKRLYLFSDHHMLVTFDSNKTFITSNTEQNAKVAKSKAKKQATLDFEKVADKKIEDEGIVDEASKTQLRNSIKNELIEKYTTQYENELNSVDKSLRISILDYENLTNSNYTIIDPHKNGTTVFGGRLNTSTNHSYYDYYTDHNTGEQKEILFGDIKNGKDYEPNYLPAATQEIEVVGQPSCFNAGTHKGVRALDMDDVNANIEFYEEQSITSSEADVSTHPLDEKSGYLIELLPGVPHPITLSVYMEGWDRDNTDMTKEASFDVSVHFKLYREGDFK